MEITQTYQVREPAALHIYIIYIYGSIYIYIYVWHTETSYIYIYIYIYITTEPFAPGTVSSSNHIESGTKWEKWTTISIPYFQMQFLEATYYFDLNSIKGFGTQSVNMPTNMYYAFVESIKYTCGCEMHLSVSSSVHMCIGKTKRINVSRWQRYASL